ncbi:hypothetical protein BRADI_5g10552v3 [Brachypodium distachyon]|uniref:Uncharacterized protein n=1 Tax=Brachypodium distachyon TaxID=15368 RepID=A0A0Q3H3H5_BRADI|nr:hypothetical protein BRADI_5g10552v3 [Brachypodium distachyon]
MCPTRGSRSIRRPTRPPSSTNRRNSLASSANRSYLRISAPELSSIEEEKRDLAAWAMRAGKERRRSVSCEDDCSMARRLRPRRTASHSSAARFSFTRQRRSETSVSGGQDLPDVSSAASILMCAISSLSVPSSSSFSLGFRSQHLPMRNVEILLTVSLTTAEATISAIKTRSLIVEGSKPIFVLLEMVNNVINEVINRENKM